MYYPSLNIGIEEEYQIIDPSSRELMGYITQSMSRDQLLVRERTPEVELVQPFGEAVIEVGTP
ncbi:MAG TPA: carboxylate-amine ligase, partial [Caldilineaceae bacterium]|nr:carboxylate-amine ligase [Caldilineaceae bacterium]